MKQLLYKLSFVLIGLVVLASCEENEIPQLDPNGQVLAQLGTTSLVLGTPEEGTSEEVEVIVTNTSDSERTISLSVVDSVTTATEDQYTLSNLVIPANSYTGTFTIAVNFDALPETGGSNLVLNLDGISGEEAIINNGTLEVEMFRKCPIITENLVGTWASVDQYGLSDSVEISLNGNGDLLMYGLGVAFVTGPWDEVITASAPAIIDVNPVDESIVIDDQYYWSTTYNGSVQPDYIISGSGKVLNACQNKIYIEYTFFQEGYGALGYTFKATLVKQ